MSAETTRTHFLEWVALGFTIAALSSTEWRLAVATGAHPVVAGAVPGALDVYAIRAMRTRRHMPVVVAAMVGVNALGYLVHAGVIPVEWPVLVVVSAIAPLVFFAVHQLGHAVGNGNAGEQGTGTPESGNVPGNGEQEQSGNTGTFQPFLFPVPGVLEQTIENSGGNGNVIVGPWLSGVPGDNLGSEGGERPVPTVPQEGNTSENTGTWAGTGTPGNGERSWERAGNAPGNDDGFEEHLGTLPVEVPQVSPQVAAELRSLKTWASAPVPAKPVTVPSLPAGFRKVSGPVSAPAPRDAEDAVLDRARGLYGDRVPSVREVKKDLNVGTARALRILGALKGET